MGIAEATLVAEPAAVYLRMVTREDALNLALAALHGHVAAHRAKAADAGRLLVLPRARLEAVLRRGQSAHRAELDRVARERPAVGLVLEGRDHRQGAAVDRAQLFVTCNFLREARAAEAHDAALAVERDRGRDRDRLLETALAEGHARLAGAVGKLKSCSAHSPPLSQTGQSSGWLSSKNSIVALWPAAACFDVPAVRTTMPSSTGVVQPV